MIPKRRPTVEKFNFPTDMFDGVDGHVFRVMPGFHTNQCVLMCLALLMLLQSISRITILKNVNKSECGQQEIKLIRFVAIAKTV